MSETQKVPEFEGFAVVELMGHRRVAGYVREAAAFGTSLLRIDIPSDDPEKAAATQYYGGGSIYALTPCTEEIVRSINKRLRETPEAVAYALPEPKQCDGSWGMGTACSPDIERDASDSDATICGRHKLERQVANLGDREPEGRD